MADQAINALPTKSSPSTGDKVLMIGTAEEYQILLDDLATAVLDKLTSKSYTLDQGTKTLITALNELNSKIITNQKYYNDANGESIFDIIDADANNGLYCYRNISDIPESSGASNEYIRILKMNECMFIIRNNSYAYFTTATSGTWRKSWYKFALTLVQ